MSCFVYHIKRPGMGLDEGYIGISNNPKRRLEEHRKSDTRVGRSLRKYRDTVMEILVEAEEWYCLEIEEKLRPELKQGWNVAIGGGKPPKATKESTEKGAETRRVNGVNGMRCELVCYDTNEVLGTYVSVSAAAREAGVSISSLSRTGSADRSLPPSRTNQHHHKRMFVRQINKEV